MDQEIEIGKRRRNITAAKEEKIKKEDVLDLILLIPILLPSLKGTAEGNIDQDLDLKIGIEENKLTHSII